MNQKGQSALEYLMTYGWALVVIVIAVAALVILINPNTIQGNQCDPKFGSFTVKQSNVTGGVGGGTQLVLVNQTGDSVTFQGASIVGTNPGALNYAPGAINLSGDTTVNVNQTGTLTITPTTQLTAGAYSLTYTLTYDVPGLPGKTATGSCRGTI